MLPTTITQTCRSTHGRQHNLKTKTEIGSYFNPKFHFKHYIWQYKTKYRCYVSSKVAQQQEF